MDISTAHLLRDDDCAAISDSGQSDSDDIASNTNNSGSVTLNSKNVANVRRTDSGAVCQSGVHAETLIVSLAVCSDTDEGKVLLGGHTQSRLKAGDGHCVGRHRDSDRTTSLGQYETARQLCVTISDDISTTLDTLFLVLVQTEIVCA